jgi:hypothetical protein
MHPKLPARPARLLLQISSGEGVFRFDLTLRLPLAQVPNFAQQLARRRRQLVERALEDGARELVRRRQIRQRGFDVRDLRGDDLPGATSESVSRVCPKRRQEENKPERHA